MKQDEYLLIISIISCIISFCGAAWWRYKRHRIPLRATLLLVWQEGIVSSFKEFRKNFIPALKNIIAAIWKWCKEKLPDIADYYQRSKQVKHTFSPDIDYCIQTAINGLANKALRYKKGIFNTSIPSYIYVLLYTQSAITEDDKAEIVWAIEAKFQEYMECYHLDFDYFSAAYPEDNHIAVYLFYCEFPSEYAAFQTQRNRTMQMKAKPAFRPLTEADLPK